MLIIHLIEGTSLAIGLSVLVGVSLFSVAGLFTN